MTHSEIMALGLFLLAPGLVGITGLTRAAFILLMFEGTLLIWVGTR